MLDTAAEELMPALLAPAASGWVSGGVSGGAGLLRVEREGQFSSSLWALEARLVRERKSGRRVFAEAATMPRPGSTVDQIVTSVGGG